MRGSITAVIHFADDGADVERMRADWTTARERTNRIGKVTGVIGVIAIPAVSLVSMLIANQLASGTARLFIAVACLVILASPIVAVMVRYNGQQHANTDRLVAELTESLARAADAANRTAVERQAQNQRQEAESKLADALDMARGEPGVIDVIERSFAMTLPDSSVELLLADNSHAHLLRMASTSSTGPAQGCGVDSPEHCPAARRAQVQRFPDSEAIDACPELRDRPSGAVSAVCVPVSIMGRTVGVIHATAPPHTDVSPATIGEVTTLAKLAGARIGLLRVMAESQLQASTDSLTGLLNRRAFERRIAAIRRDAPLMAFAMADLDHFKELNDTHGHETGDRALRVFAQVLTASLRAQDLVGRHGGEEFVIALAGCTAASARHILDSTRAHLAAAVTMAGLPRFTVSIGVVEAHEAEDFPTLTSRADAALFQAKRAGRDRVVSLDKVGNPVDPQDGPGTDPDATASVLTFASGAPTATLTA
jgi:diguanylate cyclase (GGDEF)-like protein